MAVTDKVIVECGSLGKYQLSQYLLLVTLSIAAAQQFLVVNFHNFEPKHQCSSAGWYNNTNYSLVSYDQNLTTSQDVCKKNGTKCSKFVYDPQSYPGKTLVTVFDLVCDRKSLTTISTTIFTCSLMIGALAGGFAADRFGRRWATVLPALLGTAGSLVLVFTQNMYMYAAVRSLIGACVTAPFLPMAAIGLEITGPSRRPMAIAIQGFGFPFGNISLSLIAYLLPDWKNLQICITVCTTFAALLALVFLKESPHYLVGQRRYEEAENILRNMARINGKQIDEKIFNVLREEVDTVATEKLKDILKAKTLLKRAIIFFYLWFVAGLSAYGLSFNTKNMAGNIFLNHLLMEFPGIIVPLVVQLSRCLGRKTIVITHLFLGSATLLAAAILNIYNNEENQTFSTVILIVSVAGKYSITVLFAFNYFWSSEVFPTTLRTSLGGGASFFARVGSIFSPLLVDLYKYINTDLKSGLAPIVFSITMLLGGVLTFFLPETNNTRIPETIHEANIYMTKGHEEEFRAVKRRSEGIANEGAELDEKETSKF